MLDTYIAIKRGLHISQNSQNGRFLDEVANKSAATMPYTMLVSEKWYRLKQNQSKMSEKLNEIEVRANTLVSQCSRCTEDNRRSYGNKSIQIIIGCIKNSRIVRDCLESLREIIAKYKEVIIIGQK